MIKKLQKALQEAKNNTERKQLLEQFFINTRTIISINKGT